MSESSQPGPPCPHCNEPTERRFSVLVWNIQPSWDEAYEWAGKVTRGEIKPAPDSSPEGFLKRTDI